MTTRAVTTCTVTTLCNSLKDHLRHELEGTVLELATTKEQNKQQHAETSSLIKQLERDRITHQTELSTQKSEFDNRCRDLENEFENRLNEQIADGLRRRQNLLDEFNKCMSKYSFSPE